ncbi:DUF1800 domain-containing protein [Pseudoxanthomonas sp. PXM02]|uniref:DUF1800 domain-containing protein n=1 Tax=Pseudoxanthomonas sp. PXM02 TaxID=2769294 RepID=UPI00177DB97D|nr:DUF1800 domain-containing protein [Pseudoxanthomonas sp. PXM02]MBD9478204.1 DUF1800 domain-containing protein [Pseudoxanthomonas sp. PXM02]
MIRREAVSAANRFGLGARPGTLGRIDDPRDWLHAQLAVAPVASPAALPSSADYLQAEYDYQRDRREARQAGTSGNAAMGFRERFGRQQQAELGWRYRQAVVTEQDFVERLVRFWSNHFAVSVDKRTATLYAAPMEREAIRPHATGNFADLLLAVEQHPAMLRYLDNVRSVGEQSRLAERQRRRAQGGAVQRTGLNENLAREILELHTLGVDGGYTQDDVRELARAITGWSVPAAREREAAGVGTAFKFRPNAHEAGPRAVLGRRYAANGEAQGRAILRDLAMHPATARHVCGKLARHFISDTPPPAVIERMATVWQRSGGALRLVYTALIDSDEAWSADARKLKTPDDFVVSTLRSTGTATVAQPRALAGLLGRLGQPPFAPRSPEGFADGTADWSGADAVWKRIQAAQSLAETAATEDPDPLRTAANVFGDALDADTLTAVRRAESPREGMALLFASPAFQWRT